MLRKTGMISVLLFFVCTYACADIVEDVHVWQYVDFDTSMKVTQFPQSLKRTAQVFGRAGKGYYDWNEETGNEIKQKRQEELIHWLKKDLKNN